MSIDALLSHIAETACAAQRLRSWTESELDAVRAGLPTLGYAGVGQQLGRTTAAVKIIQVRRRIAAPSKRPGFYTACQAARILGVDIHCLTELERRGLIRFGVLPGRRAIRQITRLSLWVWAINPHHWIYFKSERVRDPRLARLLELRKARWGDEWWTTAQAAAHVGIATSNTITMAILRGRLRAVRWGNWRVLRSDALAYHFTPGRGSTGLRWTARADAFLIKARGEGLPWAVIGRMMKMPPERLRLRYMKLCKDASRKGKNS